MVLYVSLLEQDTPSGNKKYLLLQEQRYDPIVFTHLCSHPAVPLLHSFISMGATRIQSCYALWEYNNMSVQHNSE